MMRGREIYVTGGGNSAGQAVVHLAKNARKVTLVVRASSLEKQMSDYLVQQVKRLSNVDVLLETEIVGGDGAHSLQHLTLRDRARGSTRTVPAELLFVLIGAVPRTEWLADVVRCDARGFVLTGDDIASAGAGEAARNDTRRRSRFETSVPGVFAVGDARSGSPKRVASAVGEGAAAVHSVHDYLAQLR
jgi:thioredoxin reductase (NADPH)